MKLQELTEAKGPYADSDDAERAAAVMKAIAAAMAPAHSLITDVEVESENMQFVVIYEFPEHRVSVGEVSAALSGEGKVRAQKVGGRGDPGMLYEIKFRHEMDEYGVLQKEIDDKYKGRQYR